MPDIAQSIPICILLSALGGSIEVLATAILARKDANERQTGKEWSRPAAICALASNVTLQLVSSITGNLIATWYGPVSIVGPIFLSSQLLANMVVFGYLLGLEEFIKDMRVGTYVVVTAVTLLPVVGPTAQDDQNVSELLSSVPALAWSCLNVGCMFAALLSLLLLDVSALKESYRMLLLLVTRATAFTVNLTVSKLVILDISTALLVVSIFLKVTSGAIITYALVIQSTAVSQAKFAPLNASALILVNATTGMIIWQDWRVVSSWTGYCCVFVQLVLGNYLLLGDVDLLSPENQKYGRGEMLRKTGILKRSEIRSLQEELTADVEEYAMFPDAALEGTQDNGTGQTAERRMDRRARMSTTKEAWSSVYFDDAIPPSSRGATNRRRTIFAIDDSAPARESGSAIC